MRRAVNALSVLSGMLGGLLLYYVAVGIVLDVVIRRLIGRGLPEIAEYADIALVGLIYLSLARTQMDGGHVSSDLVTRRIPPGVSRLAQALALVIAIACVIGVAWYAFDIAQASFDRRETRLGLAGVQVWPARWAIVVGLAIWTLQLLLRLADLVVGAPGADR